MGSSPLTRGKRARDRRAEGTRWLIPAHAGKTSRPARGRDDGRAHPRSRGENCQSIATVISISGSSPLTRGKPLRVREAGEHQGLIPAHAGKTAPLNLPWGPMGAHPRSRGENASATRSTARTRGSSPLTRGKRQKRRSGDQGVGLIPAHAGKTWDLRVGGETDWAHPRSRGENRWAGESTLQIEGSSPLTRGKHD